MGTGRRHPPDRRTPVHPAVGSVLLVLAFFSASANGDPLCKDGFAIRWASPADDACVLPATQIRTAAENARAPLLWTPGPFGPKTCAVGFVWREAYVGDIVCVTPAIREQTRQDNLLAPSRRR